MTTLSPISSLDPALALLVPPESLELFSSGALLVQAARDRTATPATRPVTSRFLVFVLVDRRDMVVLLGCAGGTCCERVVRLGGAPRRQPLLKQHGGDDDGSLEERLLREGAV